MTQALILQVVQSYKLTELFQRVILTGAGLERLGENSAGLHIKLFFKRDGQQQLNLQHLGKNRHQRHSDEQPQKDLDKQPSSVLKPSSRTYSVRHYDTVNNLLTVDFVLHPDPGVACAWAKTALKGDQVGLAGPGPMRLCNLNASAFLLIGDASSLPAIMAVIDQLPLHASVQVVMELPKGHLPFIDCERICNIKWHWLEQTFTPQTSLLPLIRSLALPLAGVSVAIASEHKTVLCLRQYFRSQSIDRDYLYCVPYWRHRQNEETYHDARHRVMDS
ncbi:MAG: hypothetical protein OFPI_16720 [Osedax symbiont Rs2]|nr:MAG: hypothetical protein OFPI_16720 [Osedax symbiont Rs2]